jgi:polyferredoxin
VIALALAAVWYMHEFPTLILMATSIASHVDFALLILLALDIVFIVIAEGMVRLFCG